MQPHRMSGTFERCPNLNPFSNTKSPLYPSSDPSSHCLLDLLRSPARANVSRARNPVKPPNPWKSPQPKPYHHIATTRNVAISYVPSRKIELGKKINGCIGSSPLQPFSVNAQKGDKTPCRNHSKPPKS